MEQNTQQFDSLRDIALEATPGEIIRHSSWAPGVTVTCSTEFLRGYGNYPYALRARENLNGFPPITKGGHWEFAGKYPRAAGGGRRPNLPRWINNVPPRENLILQ